MDGSILLTRLRHGGQRLVPNKRRLGPYPYKPRVRNWRHSCWSSTHQSRWFILAVSPFNPTEEHILTLKHRPSVVSTALFTVSIFIISQLSSPDTPAVYFLLAIFANGLCAGATINYDLAHLLHITPPSSHFIATALLNTFRGFAGSFGAAIGGGLFVRVLKSSLETGFKDNGGLEGKGELVRRLVGAPALVGGLKGVERKVAVASYAAATGKLFLTAALVATLVILMQAGTGWTAAKEVDESVTDDDWEEGLEQGA